MAEEIPVLITPFLYIYIKKNPKYRQLSTNPSNLGGFKDPFNNLQQHSGEKRKNISTERITDEISIPERPGNV